MRKLSSFLILVAMLATVLVPAPALAQDDDMQPTIIEIAQSDDQFSTLVTAVQAADPAVAELLSSEGEYTVFAPTNDAFAAVPEDDLNALLADQAALTNVLQYHVVEGEFFAADVTGLDGQSVETLSGDSINITIGENNEVFINGAQVIVPDVDASNGVVHAIDGVLMPPMDMGSDMNGDMADMDGDMAEGDMSDMDMAELDTTMPIVRVAHFAATAPAVDIYVNGEATFTGVSFPAVTDWVNLPEGTYDFAISPADAPVEDAVLTLEGVEIAFAEDSRLTLAAIGSLEDGTFTVQPFTENYAPLVEGEGRVELFHGIEGAPSVDVIANGEVALATLLGYPGSQNGNDGNFSVDVLTGSYDLDVNISGTSDAVLTAEGFEINQGISYLVAALGTPDNPQLLVVESEIPGSDTIADIVTENPDFSTLLTAIEAADPLVLDALSANGDYTVFAPTNAAFEALGEDTLNAVLADQEQLTAILLYHVLPQSFTSEEVLEAAGDDNLLVVNPLNEAEQLRIEIVDGDVVVDGATVTMFDIEANNGIIHVIDAVLIPGDE